MIMKSFNQLTNMLEKAARKRAARSVPDSTTNTPEWTDNNKRSGSPATLRSGSPTTKRGGDTYQPLKGKAACYLLRTIRARVESDYPQWSLTQDFEREVLSATAQFVPQDLDINWFDEFLGQAKTLLSSLDIDGTDILEKVEHCAVFAWQISKATSLIDYTCALSSLLSSMFGTSLSRLATKTFANKLMDIFNACTEQEEDPSFDDSEQSMSEYNSQSAESFFMSVRERFDFFSDLGDLPIMAKVYKLLLHVLSSSLLEPLGVSFDSLGYTKFEAEAIRRSHGSKMGFWHSLFDAVSLFCVMMTKAVKQGSWQPFLHNATTYEAWCLESQELMLQEKSLANPDAVGFSYFDFRQRLDDAIENGAAILRHIPTNKRREFDVVRKICSDLRYMKDRCLTKRAAQASRAAPFGILVTGGSSIGKSNFCEILFAFYGALFGHPVGSEFKYTRNFNDDFWSGFTTSKWCIVLDDIAALSTRFGTPEPTIKEVIQVLNNTAFVPAQAALEDKGIVPVLAKLVIGTTNTPDLNASSNYCCPLAIQRRLPFVVKLRPKLQFARDDSREMLDPKKLAKASSGTYDNYWHIEVSKVVQCGEGITEQRAKHHIIGVYDDIHDFLVWYAKACHEHEEQQASLARAHEAMASIVVCQACYRPRTLCVCIALPDGDTIAPTGIIPVIDEDDEEPLDGFDGLQEQEPDQVHENPLYPVYPGDELELVGMEPQSFNEVGVTFMSLTWTILLLYQAMTEWCGMCAFVLAHFVLAIFGLRSWILRQLAERFRVFVEAQARDAAEAVRREVRMLGAAIEQKLSPLTKHAKVFGATAGILAIVVSAYKLSNHLKEKKQRTDATRETTIPQATEQADIMDVGARPNPLKEERVNVWYNEVQHVTPFDVAQGSASWKGLPQERVRDIIMGYTIRLRITAPGTAKTTCALALGSWLYAVNLHALPSLDIDTFVVELICMDSKDGVNRNITFPLAQTEVYRFPSRDLAIFVTKALPPKSSVRNILVRPTFTGRYMGTYYTRAKEGHVLQNEVRGITPARYVWGDFDPTPVWTGTSVTLTVTGDCGSPLVVFAPTGPVILGLHAAGNALQSVICTPIHTEDIDTAMQHFGGFFMQSGEPMLNSATAPDRALIPVDKKCPLRYIQQGTANVYGSLTGPRARPKSCVVRTAMADAAERAGYVQRYGPPVLSGWEPWRIAYQDMLNIPTGFRSDILRAATRAFSTDILGLLHPEDLAEVMVYDVFTAVNGAPGVAYVDKLQRNTSMGFPWNRSKKFYLEAIAPAHGVPDPVEISKEVLDRTQIILDKYSAGERAMPVFKAHLKDEPTSFKKIQAKKTRLFGGAPVDWALAVRMYLLSFIRLVQNNRFIFESAPGTVTQSSEWGEIRSYLTHFGTDRIVAGDYKAFDKTMPPEFILAAFEIIIDVCRAAGFTEEQLRVVWGIGTDTAYPLYDLNGDLVEFYGSEPSGHNLTVIINGLVNCLYMRYAYIVLNPEHEATSFKDNVHLMTYGDDNVLGVSRTASWFDHTAIQKVLADHGVTYTMADKEAQTVPYIKIQDVSFLKRTWRYEEELEDYLCPLEHESIEKMLITCVASKSVAREYQGISAISSAVQEYFFYGKTTFIKRSQLLEDIVAQSELSQYVESSTFPTWNTLVERFKSYGAPKRWNEQLDKSRKRVARQTREPKNSEKSERKPAPLEEEATEDDPDEIFLPQSIVQNKIQEDLAHCGMRQRRVEPRNGPTLAGGTCDLIAAASDVGQILPPLVSDIHLYAQQSEETTPVVDGGAVSETTQETVSFMDEGLKYATGSAAAHPSSATSDALTGAELGNFLERPAQIATFTWNQADNVGTTHAYDVWQLFFANTNIQRKFTNFAWLRCDLKVKIMVNASPFYYGSMLATYQPLPNFTPTTIVQDAATRYFIPLTQRPHAWIYPQNNEGAEMTLPFFWPKNWISTLSNQDFVDMGKLSFVNFTQLLSANGAVGSGATFTIYAWAENVTLSGPTSGMTMQSKDEYGKGPISSVASAIAAAAKSLSRIPLIRPYATATQMGASAVAQAASALGYCNTPVIEDTRPVRAGGGPVFSSSEQGYPLDKLTLDPKNELSIDPSVTGCGPHDELTISHLVQKESYLCTATWTGLQAVDTLLFQSAVSPVMFDMDAVAAPKVYFTPSGWVSQMFQYWRGDVIFRFRFMATQYHRGRVRIVYDPSGSAAQNVSNTAATQVTCFNEVIDLTKDTNVEVRVPYSQALAWCRTFAPTSTSQIPWNVSNAAVFNHVNGTTNGQLIMRVVTAVTGPTASVSIPIIVSVRGASNLEFAGPTDIQSRYSQFVPQSADEYEMTSSTLVNTGKESPDDDHRFLVNHGECIFSLRQLLRRYSWSITLAPDTNSAAAWSYHRYSFHRLPRAYGYDPAGVHVMRGLLAPGTSFTFNNAAVHPINWVSSAFIGTRGSVNWTFAPSSNSSLTSAVTLLTVARLSGLVNYGQSSAVAPTTANPGSSLAAFMLAARRTSNSGALAVTVPQVNAMINVACPMYSAYKFQTTDKANITATTSQDDSAIQAFNATLYVANAQRACFEAFAAIGTDFGVHFFLNVPTFYVYSGVPANVP